MGFFCWGVGERGFLTKNMSMAECQEVGSSERKPAADRYPRKILEYMEGFLISKVMLQHARSVMDQTQGGTFHQVDLTDTIFDG